MAKEMKIPTVGESITEVVIANWLVEDGDHVEMDDLICELESDKATFEVPAEADGIIRLKAQAGDTLEIGALLCVIEEGENGSESKEETKTETKSETKEEPKSEPKQETSAKTETFIMKIPTVGESISEVVLANWLVEDGEEVELDDPICELESDKANFEVPAEKAGKVFHMAEAGSTLAIGDDFAKIEMGGNDSSSNSNSTSSGSSKEETSAANAPNSTMYSSEGSGYAKGHASVSASKMLAEKGIDSKDVQGTGRDGRIIKEDAQNAQKSSTKSAPSQPKAPAAAKKDEKAPVSAESSVQGERSTSVERMSSLRKTIAKRLVAAKNQTAMLTTFNEVDMSAVMEMRKKYKDKFKETHEVGLGFMSFFTKAVTMALMEIPGVNAQITGEKGDEILYHNYADVSIAVSSPRGLVVPVIRNAEKLSFAGVEKEVVRLALKARDGKLTIDEMSGGTFTITNGGIFGSMLSTPIINAPQSAILGLHNIVQRPVAIDGKVEIRPIMYVALSYDHRIVDGKESVTFLYRIKELIEDPSRLLLGV